MSDLDGMKGTIERNPENVYPLIDGQVLVSFEEDPKIGQDGSFNEDWETVGILADGSKIEITKAVEKSKVKGWGYGVLTTNLKPGDLMAKCSVLERNATVDKIAWPDKEDKSEEIESARSAAILFGGAKAALCHVAMVTTRQDGVMEIMATRYKSIASMENIGYGEDPEGREITFDFKLGRLKDVFDRLELNAGKAAARKVDLIRFSEEANEGKKAEK